MRKISIALLAMAGSLASFGASATLVSIDNCVGANSCDITTTPPNPVVRDPNDGILLAWDEVQNFTLTAPLRVDRVFDPTADFITDLGNGDFLINAGTIVSSHYLQWDPGNSSASTVTATIVLDSQVFAFITADQNLFDSDDLLGLPGLDYNDFGLRGLEGGDLTDFNGEDVDISWSASSPGDWTRLITAFSPSAPGPDPTPVPEPSTFLLFGLGLLGLRSLRR
jgi:hypothetical protein